MTMINQLVTRNRVDRFRNDVRAPMARRGVSWSRFVYLAFLLGFFGYVANTFFGSYLWLRADGLVSADRSVVGAAYEAQVTRMDVAPGQNVSKGQRVGQVYSPRIAEQMATIAARYADLQSRASELQVRLQTAQSLITLSQHRTAQAEEVLEKMERLKRDGIVPGSFHSAALNDRYAAMQDKTRNEVELRVMADQLILVRKAQDESRAALAELKSHYNAGELRAPADGIVGAQLAKVGNTVAPGEFVAEIYSPDPYVLAYLSTGTLYKPKQGDRVKVTSGFNEARGTIVEVLPMTVRLPNEFQKTFASAGQGQAARIELDPGSGGDQFPLFDKVYVTAEKFIDTEALEVRLSELQQRWMRVRETTQAVIARLGN